MKRQVISYGMLIVVAVMEVMWQGRCFSDELYMNEESVDSEKDRIIRSLLDFMLEHVVTRYPFDYHESDSLTVNGTLMDKEDVVVLLDILEGAQPIEATDLMLSPNTYTDAVHLTTSDGERRLVFHFRLSPMQEECNIEELKLSSPSLNKRRLFHVLLKYCQNPAEVILEREESCSGQ